LKKGFTLVELIIVVIIVGILASIGLTQYNKVVEKGRATECRMLLGTLRGAEVAASFETGSYVIVANLGVDAPSACVSTHYFSYSCDATSGTCTATRCIGGAGKPQTGSIAWTKSLTVATGTWTGTPGY